MKRLNPGLKKYTDHTKKVALYGGPKAYENKLITNAHKKQQYTDAKIVVATYLIVNTIKVLLTTKGAQLMFKNFLKRKKTIEEPTNKLENNYEDYEDYDDDYEEDNLSVWDAAEIWASNGKDEDYMFGYSREELEDAL